MSRGVKAIWGGTQALLLGSEHFTWVDLLVLLGLGGLVFGVFDLAEHWTAPHQQHVAIDLSPWALPEYTFLSLSRGLLAYAISLVFTLVYGYWAAKDLIAERVLLPLLDILQSIPVLGFMPGLVLGLVVAFPRNNVGLELAAIVMIFTGQAWNMTFSFYHSLRSVPTEMREVATVYRFSWWERFRWVELPFATVGLVWNSMMSMAGGWFFLMITEAFRLGNEDFRLPGLGSYMSEAVDREDAAAMVWGVAAMMAMIATLDQLVWRPVIVWAQKYRVEDVGAQEIATSWFLNWLRRSHLLRTFGALWRRLRRTWERERPARTEPPAADTHCPRRWPGLLSLLAFVALLSVLTFGAVRLALLLRPITGAEWLSIAVAAFWTLLRVIASTALGTLWALPAGLAIGLSPRLSRVLQPLVQMLASFPAPMLFPVVVAVLTVTGVRLEWGSILLMLLGTQWYILFNVIAGAMAIPADLKEAARSYNLGGWQRFWGLYVPAVFPQLVTGWITAAGGAWNASIVAEYVTYHGGVQTADGLGARISEAAAAGNLPLLAASVVMMSLVVVLFNRAVWKRCYRLAEERFSLAR